MSIFSNPIFINVILAIGVAVLWIGSCRVYYNYGRRRGYTECMDNVRMNNVRAKRRSRRKSSQNSDIRVLNPVEPRKRYAEAESVRIVATRAPRFEEEDQWM